LSREPERAGDEDEVPRMKVKDIEQYVTRQPFQPFRLVLDTGEQVTVRNPRKALLSGKTIVVVGVSRTGSDAAGTEKLRMVRVDNIISAQHVSANEI